MIENIFKTKIEIGNMGSTLKSQSLKSITDTFIYITSFLYQFQTIALYYVNLYWAILALDRLHFILHIKFD